MEVTILRPPMVYGPRDTSALKYIRTISFGFMPYLGGWGANKVNVLYATDMGSACAMALKKKHPSGKTYCLNDGGTYIWRELLLEIQRALGRPAISGAPLPLRLLRYAASANERLSALTGRIPALTVDRLADLCEADWLGDSTDAENDLDWRPRTCWAEGIKLAVSWYREEGWLS
jgi:nucleoside-diphosphate-sugar epimerase